MSGQLDGAEILDRVLAFFRRFVAFPSEHCLTVVALWTAHTHIVESFYVSPRLVLDSAEPGSGKTRVLEILNLLCRSPEMTISASTAAIFRMIAEHPISLLFDEIDAIFSPKAAGNAEDLRALLNSGYKRGATIARCVGDAKAMKVQRFKVYSPVALAGLAGNMPPTITTRAVVIHMRRRGPGETVDPFRERYAVPQANPIRKDLAAWCTSKEKALADAEPDMPTGVVDRPAEVWEALLAIADAAGGDWPANARAACKHFVLKGSSEGSSLGQRLLGDIRTVFGDRADMATVDLIAALVKIDTAPWSDLWGKPLDARRLAKELGRYGVAPVPFKNAEDKTVKGYTTYPLATKENETAGLTDAWARYLKPTTAVQGNEGNEGNDAGQDALPLDGLEVTGVTTGSPGYPCEGNRARKGNGSDQRSYPRYPSYPEVVLRVQLPARSGTRHRRRDHASVLQCRRMMASPPRSTESDERAAVVHPGTPESAVSQSQHRRGSRGHGRGRGNCDHKGRDRCRDDATPGGRFPSIPEPKNEAPGMVAVAATPYEGVVSPGARGSVRTATRSIQKIPKGWNRG